MAAGRAARAVALLLAGLLGAGGCATGRPGAAPALELGPVVSRDTAPDGHARIRAAGPFYEARRGGGATYHAVHPFYGSLWDPLLDRRLTEYLYPLGMKKEFRGETDWRFLLAFGHDFDNQAESRYRYVVFPVVSGGRDAAGEGYFAVFPIGGSVHEFFGYERWSFVLFPLYSSSSKKDQQGWAVLWPFVARTRGKTIEAFRVFPFYGYREKKGVSRHAFVMWPFFTRSTYHHERHGDGSGFLLFPLYGHASFKETQTWYVLPPFFRRTVGPDLRVLNCPWPFIQVCRADVNKTYVWPIAGRRRSDTDDYRFVAWPFLTWRRIDRVDHVVKRFRFLPLLVMEKQVEKPRTPHPLFGSGSALPPSDAAPAAAPETDGASPAVIGRTVTLWPLFDYTRKGAEWRYRMLNLWPGWGLDGVDRNWSRLWTLYSRTGLGETRESEFLWGLYRRRSEPGKGRSVSVFPFFSWSRADDGDRECAFLLGLFRYSRQSDEHVVRVLGLFDVGAGRRDER